MTLDISVSNNFQMHLPDQEVPQKNRNGKQNVCLVFHLGVVEAKEVGGDPEDEVVVERVVAAGQEQVVPRYGLGYHLLGKGKELPGRDLFFYFIL